MTTPPADWQDKAREEMDRVAGRFTTLSVFIQSLRIALADDDYQACQEARLWLQAEEAEA